LGERDEQRHLHHLDEIAVGELPTSVDGCEDCLRICGG